VAPAPKNNGGATAPGVTATTVTVVVMLPNAAQYAAGSSKPLDRATGVSNGSYKDAFIDEWAAYKGKTELWGREPQFTFVTSSGDDEASQRADAVTVAALKPFAVIDTLPNSLPILGTVLAADKILVYAGSGTFAKDTTAQAPYRWGTTDVQASAGLTAEWAGKQLVGGKAQWAGDSATQAKTRTFGAVYSNLLEIDPFLTTFKQYKGTLAVPAFEYQAAGGTLGDAASAQQQAPTIIAKLKDAGVTSVFLFSDSQMDKALTAQATVQDYHPEWLLTTFQFADLGLLSRSYDQTQWAHAFGLSALGPYINTVSAAPVFDWYWGKNGTLGTSVTYASLGARWLAYGIQYAGPKLSPKTFQQGYFATPARGASAYGKTAGLPYDEYMWLGTTVSGAWYDATTVGTSQVRLSVAAGVTWYVNGAQSYTAATIPKKTFNFFDKTGSVYQLENPVVPLGPVVACADCPANGGTGATPSHAT